MGVPCLAGLDSPAPMWCEYTQTQQAWATRAQASHERQGCSYLGSGSGVGQPPPQTRAVGRPVPKARVSLLPEMGKNPEAEPLGAGAVPCSWHSLGPPGILGLTFQRHHLFGSARGERPTRACRSASLISYRSRGREKLTLSPSTVPFNSLWKMRITIPIQAEVTEPWRRHTFPRLGSSSKRQGWGLNLGLYKNKGFPERRRMRTPAPLCGSGSPWGKRGQLSSDSRTPPHFLL